MDLKIKTIDSDEAMLQDGEFARLRSGLRGQVIEAGGEGYDQARKVWNGLIDRRPALILRCMGAADVIAAVNFAREHSLLVSVRGGGHNVGGLSLADGGLVIDLSGMKEVRVDPVRRTVRASPGVTLGELDRETQASGLVVPSGIVTSTGIAGLTLGGGFGWLHRKWGLTCDNLISADVVTADGSLLHASAEENPDLFWGIRGGGGNFGIVVWFEYKCYPFGPTALAGVVIHPFDQAKEMLKFYRDFTARAPNEVTTLGLLRKAPPAPFIPKEYHGQPVGMIGACYAGPPDEGVEAIRTIKEWGRPIADVLAPKPFVMHQSMFDAGQPAGGFYYTKSHYFNELSDEVLEVMVERTRGIASPMSILGIFQMGGAVADVGEQETAYPSRKSSYLMNINGSWADPSAHATNIAWTRDTWEAVKPFATGGRYVNFEPEDQVMAIYGEEKYRRLQQVKQRYDPDNFFRLNQNIKPAG